MAEGIRFLERLLDAPGPSGFESRPARIWREEAESFATDVRADVSGNSMAAVNPDGAPRVMLAGHVDEIGLMITHVDDEGFLYFAGIGGWDSQVLVGQRVRILAQGGDVLGVIGKKPIHLLKTEEKDKVTKIEDLWIDIGAKDREATQRRGVRVGDPCVLEAPALELNEDLIASRAIDNRIGAFVVLEALRLLAADPPAASVTAVATSQEEIGYSGGGARTSAYAVDPAVALVVDVTFATDSPGVEKKELGDHKLGGGPVLSRGSAAHPLVFERLAGGGGGGGDPAYHPGGSPGHPDGRRRDPSGAHRGSHRPHLGAQPLHAFAQRDRQRGGPPGHGPAPGRLRPQSRRGHRLHPAVGRPRVRRCTPTGGPPDAREP
jgi:putative aminopeptidase FrvX